MTAYDFMDGSPTNNTHQAVKSPVPYLIGGLAAVLGLVALSLLMLLCSLNRESDQHQESSNGGNHNNNSAVVERGEKNFEVCREDTEAKVMVIMAGDERPTFLAKPAMCRAGDMENTV